jgi:AcrR family transcriptional regulator
MPREKNQEKRQAFLRAAVAEIAKSGTETSTARIARRAGLAESTLFTYFPSKSALLNVLYIELKDKVYQVLNSDFPADADLYARARHIWVGTLAWGVKSPNERKASLHLHLSNAITAATRAHTDARSVEVRKTMAELSTQGIFRELPTNFSATAMGAMQDAVLEEIARNRKDQAVLIAKGFEAFWRLCL